MTCVILVASLLAQTPAELHAAALTDLVTRVPPERQRDTRYVSLHAAPPGLERETLYKALLFSLNSTSFRSNVSVPPRMYRGALVKISLSAFRCLLTRRLCCRWPRN